MSINRRTALAVRSIGVASAAGALALGVAGTSYACSITEFSGSASCDNAGHGVITVVDKDGSGTSVDITLLQGGNEVASQQGVKGSQKGVNVDFSVDWTPKTEYTVKVVKEGGVTVGETKVTTPDDACTPTDQGGTSTGGDNSTSGGDNATTGGDNATTGGDNSTTGGDNSTTTGGDNSTTGGAAATTGGKSTTTPPAAVADTNAPKPATGTSNLAETGGGSNSGMIAGIAGAFVVLGGGTVFMMRRRKPASQS